MSDVVLTPLQAALVRLAMGQHAAAVQAADAQLEATLAPLSDELGVATYGLEPHGDTFRVVQPGAPVAFQAAVAQAVAAKPPRVVDAHRALVTTLPEGVDLGI